MSLEDKPEVEVKHLTGSRLITGREMSESPFNFKATGELHISTGHVPDITGGKSFWRRMVPVDKTQGETDGH